MNEELNQQLLQELRKLRRLVQIALCACILLFAFTVAMSTSRKLSQVDSWTAVRAALDQGDYEKASNITQRLIVKRPNDYDGYTYLGYIALATGDLKSAETNYARAYALLPSEENEKTLNAVRLRAKKENWKLLSDPKP